MTARSISVDAIDRVLLRALQADGRASWADLAAHVGLSAPAVRQRVQRLSDAGVLQIVAVTDPLALGLPVMALVGVKVTGDTATVADAIGELPGVIYVVSTAGSFDVFAEVVCSDLEALRDLIDSGIRQVANVTSAEPFVYYGIHAHRFSWDIPDE